MPLSDRIRPDVEAAPWVIAEIRKLEARCAALLDIAKDLKSIGDRMSAALGCDEVTVPYDDSVAPKAEAVIADALPPTEPPAAPARVNEPRPAPPKGKPAAWVNGWRCATGYGGGGMPPLGNASKRTMLLYNDGYAHGRHAILAWLARGNTTRQA